MAEKDSQYSAMCEVLRLELRPDLVKLLVAEAKVKS